MRHARCAQCTPEWVGVPDAHRAWRIAHLTTDMTPLDLSEVRPGLVVRLDTEALRAAGGSETNAQATAEQDRAVRGVHDFLVLAVDAARGVCTAVPLFPKTAPGSSPLDRRKRAGDAAGWHEAPAFFSHWQHWRIPLAALSAAAADDPGAPGARRSFAATDADALQDVLNWASRNRCAFRPA